MRKSFRKFHSRLINYRSYKNFSNEAFRGCLLVKLSKEVFVKNDKGLQWFCDLNLQVLNQRAPQKIKYVGGNQMPFMTKQLSKEIMQRSRCQHANIPIKIIKDNLEIFPDFLCTNINSFFKSSSFPSCLKMADVTSLHKKGKKTKKKLQAS